MGNTFIAERAAFEKDFMQRGGQLNYLKWVELKDQTAAYQVDWTAIEDANISEPEFNESIQSQAEYASGCLESWVGCAKSKANAQGFFTIPSMPDKDMIKAAIQEFNNPETSNLEDKIVFAHQAMISTYMRNKNKG